MAETPFLTGVEREVGADEIIVSKTDPRGVITYANAVFARVCGWSQRELLGAPHSIVRHPDMPRCVFKLLWDRIAAGREIFAYVLNRARNGDHYWVFAHVTPTFAADGTIVGYHSNRRRPDRSAVDAVRPLYAKLLAEEARHASKEAAMAAATRQLTAVCAAAGVDYDELVFSLVEREAPLAPARAAVRAEELVGAAR